METKIKLPSELEGLVQRELRSARFTPDFDNQETLLKYQPKEESKRDWVQYENNCRREKLMFLRILKFAINYLDIQNSYKGNGRPNAQLNEVVKALCIRLYSQFSSWRCESEFEMCKAMGFIDNIYKRSTMNKYMQSKEVTKILNRLIEIIALPIAKIEMHFSADATGIGHAYAKKRWIEVRDKPQLWKYYRKLHIISGAKTNIIVTAIVSEGHRHDSPFLKGMFEKVKDKYNIKEFSADAGYLSRKNVKLISRNGSLPFIKPKKNLAIPTRFVKSAWGQMLKLWKTNQELFCHYYNQRQNVEATFGMLKRKFGGTCRSKNSQAQVNEILTKVVCHNAVILARAMVDFNLDVKFMDSL